MLFFRSEDQVRAWCRMREVEPRPLVSLAQLRGLAVHWYSSRLEPDSRRPGPDEMRRIFAELGLRDAFWDPQADMFA